MKQLRHNLLLVITESTRADYVLAPGSPNHGRLPTFERLAAEGVHFPNAYSNGAWTVPSIASMLTALYPSEHRQVAGENRTLPEGVVTLPEVFRNAGGRSYAIYSTDYVTDKPSLCRGFDRIFRAQDRPRSLRQLVTAPPQWLSDIAFLKAACWSVLFGADKRTWHLLRTTRNTITAHLRSAPEVPFCAIVHLQAPHAPYAPPRGWRSPTQPSPRARGELGVLRDPMAGWKYMSGVLTLTDETIELYRQRYADEIRYVDFRIGQLISALETFGVLDDTLVIVLGDHGEHLGEHRLLYHHYSLGEPIIHVPLVMRFPHCLPTGATYDPFVSHVDLLPTILELLAMPDGASSRCRGRSFASLVNEPRSVIAEYERPQIALARLRQVAPGLDTTLYNCALKAICDRDYKYVASSDGREWLTPAGIDRRGPEAASAVESADIARTYRERLQQTVGLFDHGHDTLI